MLLLRHVPREMYRQHLHNIVFLMKGCGMPKSAPDHIMSIVQETREGP